MADLIEFAGHRGKAGITIAGKPLPDAVKLIRVRLTDKRGLEPDTLNIELDDSKDTLPLPQKKAVITLHLGWDKTRLFNKGSYTVTNVRHEGPPDKIMITAQSADLLSGLKQPRKKSWASPTLGTIITDIAALHGLRPIIGKELKDIQLAHVEQHDESDVNLLTRLSQDYDAIAQVKSGRLIFMPKGKSVSVDGKPLDEVIIARAKGDTHTFDQDTESENITGVQAYWRDIKGAKRRTVKIGEDGNRRHLKNTYPNEAEALAAAKAKWQHIQRGVHTFRATLARGMPELIVESPVRLKNYKQEINALNWVGQEIEHVLDDNGLITDISLEEVISG